jgi:hypothetical protein
MRLLLMCILAGFYPVAAHGQQVSGIPVPAIIQNDATAAALFPNLVGFRTAQICHARDLAITDDQLKMLTTAVERYADSSGISKEARDAVWAFSEAVVNKQAEEWGPSELQSKCSAVSEIFTSLPDGPTAPTTSAPLH